MARPALQLCTTSSKPFVTSLPALPRRANHLHIQLLPLLSFILCIPAAESSSVLRVAYLLQLTGFLSPALDGYTVLDENLPLLFDVLSRFDQGWVAILRGQDWDSSTGTARPLPPHGTRTRGDGMRTTDRIRLETLVKNVKQVLAVSLGLPEFVPLEEDPFELLLKQSRERTERQRIEEAERPQRESKRAKVVEEQAVDMLPASESGEGGATPSLVSDTDADGDDAMSVDTAVATPSASSLVLDTDDGEDEEASDDDFEEVIAVSSSSALPSAYSTPPAADGSFSIHFTGPPPPSLQDQEISLANGATPIVGQSRGFDPDEEYPPENEEGERVGEDREGEHGEEDGIDGRTREKVKRVFEQAEKVLAELRSVVV